MTEKEILSKFEKIQKLLAQQEPDKALMIAQEVENACTVERDSGSKLKKKIGQRYQKNHEKELCRG